MASKLRPFWLSWYASAQPLTQFEYHGPWWISGSRDEGDDSVTQIVCAAVMATSEKNAQDIIRRAHDEPRAKPEWRGEPQARAHDWAPFCDRFRRAKWMRWPWPGADGEPRPVGGAS